jgi:hypothetical protein
MNQKHLKILVENVDLGESYFGGVHKGKRGMQLERGLFLEF